MSCLDLVHSAANLLDFSRQSKGIGPESEVLVPFWKRESFKRGAIFLFNLPIFESHGKFLLIEVQNHVIKLIVFGFEVVFVLSDGLIVEEF